MTTVFYAPPAAFRSGIVELPADEARHATRVLRHSTGDEIVVVDGVGGRHLVRLHTVERGRVAGEVTSSELGVAEPAFDLTVGLGVMKNAGRFETFVEKAVELGVNRIIPLITERTERPRIRQSRLTGIAIAAMKQSGRCRLPQIDEPVGIDRLLMGIEAPLRILCHEGAAAESSLSTALEGAGSAEHTIILIGPEGGFTDSEVESAGRAGWRVASLGPRRLRAETAAIVSAAAVMLRMERGEGD